MNQDSFSYALTQISYLVSNLNKKNFAVSRRQLAQFVKDFGQEADRHLLRCLFSAIDFTGTAIPVSRLSCQARLLATELASLINKPNLVASVCFAIDNPLQPQLSLKPSLELLLQITETLSSPLSQGVALGISLVNSKHPEIVVSADRILRISLPLILKNYAETALFDDPGPNRKQISPEFLHHVLSHLSHGKYKTYELDEVLYNRFIERLCQEYPRNRVPVALVPFLYADESEISADSIKRSTDAILQSAVMDPSWASLVMDIGYSFTATLDECKGHLLKVGGREVSAQDVAKIISSMCLTHATLSESSINLPTPAAFWSQGNDPTAKGKDGQNVSSTSEATTWKPEILVQALKEVVPNLNWKEVCLALDHPDFLIKDRGGLVLLLNIFKMGMQASSMGQNLPVECIYQRWSNVDGQLSLITMILKNPDLYSFADHIYTSVSVELLKTPPETDNKEVASWTSLHLVDALLYIAEHGLFVQVMDIFKIPITLCPDIIFMALLQINPPMTVARQDLFQTLVPIFLGNHPNSGTILHHAWNNTNFNLTLRHIILHSMSEWYLRGENDQSRLSRILDVAQDLKALSNLLNIRSFIFIIDLACLASRREYLKLEKWLADKIREHGESFVKAIIKFLQRRCPQLMVGKFADEQIPKSAQLPPETISTILTCLQSCVGNVTPEVAEMIMGMTQYNMLLNSKARVQPTSQPQQAPPPGVLRSHRGLEAPFSASTLGGQIFPGPTVDTLSGIAGNMTALNIGGPAASSAFSFGTLVSTPPSPSRLLAGASNSPFPLMSMPSTAPLGNIGRLAQTPTNDKLNLPATATQGTFPEMVQQVSKEVEDEANSYFQRIYNHPPHATLSIDEVLDMLQRFKDSPIRRECDVYQCMLRNLFEEYKFFPQYPEKELQTTAQLFGGMVERNLVTTYVALGLALRCVLDALKKPEGSKMYYFGITALDRFKNKLHLYPKYCDYVHMIQHFNEFPPHLIEYVEYGAMGQEPPNKNLAPVPLPPANVQQIQAGPAVGNPLYRSNSVPGTSNLTAATAASTTPAKVNLGSQLTTTQPPRVKSIANATNIDTLLVATQDREEKIIAPPDAIQDKTAFIFNNLSQINLQQKCEEIKEILQKDYYAWLAQYLVLKRASIEVNFHVLYSNFLDALKIPDINKLVTKETFRNIKVLLRSDKGIANFSDRSLLKNLGHWLGMMTLGRSRPILHLDIDMKSLLVEAYNKGQQELLYVVPFVAKVLESCAKSKVFKPPNPWTMAIMNLLAELHQEPDVKLNLKFEIEVLCKNLSIDVADLKPAIYLKDPERAQNIEHQLSQPKPQKEPPPMANIQAAEEIVAAGPSSSPASAVMDASLGASGPPEPRFQYSDINITNFSSINQHVTFSANVAILHSHPHLKQIVKNALERTITDWITPIVERSIKIASKTSEQIIRKDFALEGDETRIRTAAHNMSRNLAAGMAMITCRDQVLQSIQSNVKAAFITTLSPAQKDVAEAAANQLAADNLELVSVFIQKTALEKVVPEMDKLLAADYDLRKMARQEGRRYCDNGVVSYQTDRMPERIRLNSAGIGANQLAVYEEFARNIPGFQPITERDNALLAPKLQEAQVAQYTTPNAHDEIMALYEELANKMETFINGTMNVPQLQVQFNNMHSLLECLIVLRRSRDTIPTMNLLNKAVEGIMEGVVNIPDHLEQVKMYRDIHLRALRLIQDTRAYGQGWANKAITRCMIECREDIRYNIEGIDALISSNFVFMPQYDLMLAQLVESGTNYMAIMFAMQLVQIYLIDERPNSGVTETDLVNTIEVLIRLASHPRAPDGLAHLIETLRANNDPNALLVDRTSLGPTSFIHAGILQARANEIEDSNLVERAEYLLKDWIQIYHTQAAGREPFKAFSVFVNKMNAYGILKGDEPLTRFFRHATQYCIDLTYRTELNGRNKIFHCIDAYVRLIALLVKHSGESGHSNTKLNLLNKILGIVVGILLQDQELHATTFQQLGYHRIFIMLFLELTSHDPVLENISLNVVTAFCHTFYYLRPAIAPGFCYSWLELISHRVFIGRILATLPQQKGWSMYSQLLINLFKYLAPFLRNAELAKPVQHLYKGTLRVLLVLLHDFPEFLCDYHFGFCDVIPPNCIQMRNLILSAYPRNMRLPDPFTPNLKVDMLTDIGSSPRIFTNYAAAIQPTSFKKDLDSYLKARAPVTFLSELRSNLQISNEPGSRYNIPLMNALVLYVGTQAIAHIRSKNLGPTMATIVHSAHMDIFQNLAVDLDNEGRYLFLNAIANQLRYPNSHTHYFSCAILYLFVESNSEAIQEQITRVLLERLIVNRPHPWGLLITFIELIKNPVYKFWAHEFVHCAPEIEKLFESVANSCMVMKSKGQPQLQNVESEIAECN